MNRINLHSINDYPGLGWRLAVELAMATRYKLEMVMGTGHTVVSAEFELHKIYIRL